MKNPFINFSEIKEKAASAKIVAVSKYQSDRDIALMSSFGIEDFGENQVQQFLKRQIAFPKLNWHFIGQLQTNKVKYLINKVYLIQSLDSIKLAQKIQEQSLKNNTITDCLIQLRFEDNDQKGGVTIEQLDKLYNYCRNCPNISIKGFMVIAPLSQGEEVIIDVFSKTKDIFANYQKEDKNIQYLSMGMSSDYVEALKCGANMLRIGEKLFTKE